LRRGIPDPRAFESQSSRQLAEFLDCSLVTLSHQFWTDRQQLGNLITLESIQPQPHDSGIVIWQG
jgi:hypothetical protein